MIRNKRKGGFMSKRLAVIAACLTLLVCMLALPASAAENNVVSGRWQFDDTISPSFEWNYNGEHEVQVSFTSAGYSYNKILFNSAGTMIYNSGLSGSKAYDASNGWVKDDYKIIDFGSEPISVSADFYNYLSTNAVWLDAPPPPPEPSPFDDILGGIGALFTAAIGWVGTVATIVADNPLILLAVLIPLVGLGIGFFVRIKNVSR